MLGKGPPGPGRRMLALRSARFQGDPVGLPGVAELLVNQRIDSISLKPKAVLDKLPQRTELESNKSEK